MVLDIFNGKAKMYQHLFNAPYDLTSITQIWKIKKIIKVVDKGEMKLTYLGATKKNSDIPHPLNQLNLDNNEEWMKMGGNQYVMVMDISQ